MINALPIQPPLERGVGLQELKRQAEEMRQEKRVLSEKLQAAVASSDHESAGRILSELIRLDRLIQAIVETASRLSGERDGRLTFMIGALLIFEAFNLSIEQEPEIILYSGGNWHGSLYTMERLYRPKLDESNFGYARANIDHSALILGAMDDTGEQLTCYFHTHPGSGPKANHPSAIDLATQDRYERGGYCVIGGIFSRDGYLRFFSKNLPFSISIGGKGVSEVAQGLYKLAPALTAPAHLG